MLELFWSAMSGLGTACLIVTGGMTYIVFREHHRENYRTPKCPVGRRATNQSRRPV